MPTILTSTAIHAGAPSTGGSRVGDLAAGTCASRSVHMIRDIVRPAAALAVIWCAGLSLSAQAGSFADAQRANQAALRHYTWKSRTELSVAGESKGVRLEQVRYDLDGRLQTTTIGGSSDQSEPRAGLPGPGGAIRKRVVARKREEFQELLEQLAALAERYAHLPPARAQAFAAGAAITPGEGIETGSLRVTGQDVLLPGDRLVLWVDPATFMTRRVEIVTVHDGHPVSVVSDFRSLENGLTYQARSILRYPEKRVEIAVESFEYVFVGGTAR